MVHEEYDHFQTKADAILRFNLTRAELLFQACTCVYTHQLI